MTITVPSAIALPSTIVLLVIIFSVCIILALDNRKKGE